MAYKILIVDDETELADKLAKKLNDNGYIASAIYDGNECLKRIKADKPDLLVLDIILPGIDGYSILRQLRAVEETRDLPIVIVTAKEMMKDLFEMEGVNDYIVKPINEDELLLRIFKALKSHSS